MKKDRNSNKVFNNNQGRGIEKLSQTETSSKQEGLTFAYTDKNGKKYTFRMPNESENAINIDQARPYTEKADDLIEYAKKLRRQKLFGDIDVEELAKSYPFVPFKYQIENVKTMLNRFEGNGVFGDQVGLGKTVQALMTAHAMFASGAIRNALIVVTAKTRDGWIEEIENKFPGVFEICEEGTFIDILTQIKSDNDSPKKSGNRIYIVTEYMLKQNLEAISYAFTTEMFRTAFNAPLSEENEKDFKNVEGSILGLKVWQGKQDIENILKSCGWRLDECTSLAENLKSSFLHSMSDRKYARLENIFEERLNNLNGQVRRDNISVGIAANETSELLQEIQNEHEKQKSLLEISPEDKILGLLTSPEKRLIDLLIVDEVHSFYDKEASNQENFSESDLKSAVELLAKIHKKYCILLSATPIRTRLEDIFDLIFIADRKRVGEDRDAALAYFYNTICQLPKGEKGFLLSKMIYDEERRKNFFGMVNNFFTRKRICEVEEQMGKTDNKVYDGYYEKFKEEMINARSLMYMQAGVMEDAETKATESYQNWVEKNCPVPNKQILKRKEWKNPIKHWNAALDKVFIKEADNSEKDSNERRMAHDRVNWRRRHKCGIAVTVDEQNSIEKVLCCSGEQDVWAEAIRLKIRRGITSEHIFMKDSVDIVETLENFRNSLRNDTVAVYVSCGETRGALRDSLAAAYQNRAVAIPDKADKLPEITKENYNQIVLLDGGFQAGVNLQQYRTFVFAQMDYRGQRLLEPVDIEQWIGRIHRTGQVKNCRIITVLKTDMKKKKDPRFLKWYYEILSDPEGLDLYGDNTPDVAFLQPIIVDKLRSMISEIFEEKINDSFATLLEICYCLDKDLGNDDKKTKVKEMIRKLCKIEELGRKKA